MVVGTIGLAVLVAVRRPVPANEIILTPKMWQNEGMLLSIENGELTGFKEVLFSEIPSVGLLGIRRQRNLGGFMTALTEPEYISSAMLRVTNMDVEYAPQKTSGKPDRNYWADKSCEKWPSIRPRKTSSYTWSIGPDKVDHPVLFKTFEGATGVFKVTKINEDEIHLCYRIIESAAQTTGPQTQNLSERYIRRLPNGVGIELIGISSNPSGENHWWKPDGLELERAPYFNINDKHPRKIGQEAYEIASRIVRTADDVLFGRPILRIPTSLAQAELTTRDEFDHLAFDVGASVILFKADIECATVEFGIATGELKTIVVPQKGPRTARFDSYVIEVSPPEEKDDRITIDTTLPQVMADEYCLLFSLVDPGGKRHYLRRHGEAVTSADPTMVKQKWRSYPVDHYLRASDIKECRIDICRYQWLKFNNVSLRPGENHGFENGS